MRMAQYLFLFLFSASAYSQILEEIPLTQSSSSIKWETISNENVKLIYPDYLRDKSLYLANLVEHYSHYVGLTYDIKQPKQFTLVIRPEMGEPNGFVTLGPRRSEWFSSSSFTDFVGSSEWYQTLAIHEYRHVVQFDNYKKNSVKGVSYFFGDIGEQFLAFTGLQSWYMEGDAVWSETKYTDAGRGRSPMFMARLKALVLSNKIPTYDEFVNGSYNNSLVNQYVYGYVLISNATKKFGDDFWKKVIFDVTVYPHPFKLYSSFKTHSGQDFIDFYNETMNELKAEWSKDADPSVPAQKYRENIFPYKEGNATYSLYYDLDSYWSLYKEVAGKKEKIAELPFVKELNQFHMANGKAVYAQYLPDSRYGYKGSSDIILMNINTGDKKKITFGQRLYSPRLNKSATKIYATEFTTHHQWNLSEFDLNGNKLRSVHLKDFNFSEIYPINDNEVFAILADSSGHKSLARVNLQTNEVKNLLPASRNNIYSLTSDEAENIYFQAQYMGATDIFRIGKSGGLAQCTQSKISATTPSVNGQTLYYSNQDSYGSKVAMSSLADCKQMDSSSLVNFNYLGKSPSDNYNNFPVQSFDDQKDLYTKNADKYTPESYGHIDSRLFVPHSWGFIGGRGYALTAKSDNYLGTLGMDATLGSDAEEDTSYSHFNLDIKKFYPLFRLSAEAKDREVQILNSTDELKWKEKNAGISMMIPDIYTLGLFNFQNAIKVQAQYSDMSKVDAPSYSSKGQHFYIKTAEYSGAFFKSPNAKSITAPWALSYKARYDDAHNPSSTDSSTHRFYHQAQITTPGLFDHNGLTLTFDQEKQKVAKNVYRFIAADTSPNGYVFSRGYDYESVPEYRKFSANYHFPIAYPDFNAGGYYYLRRIIANAFFDSTKLESSLQNLTYNSMGMEMEFESKIFRILPINLGLRYTNKTSTKQQLVEFYTSLTFDL